MAIATMSNHNDSMNGSTEEEVVTATPDEAHENRYIAQVLVKKTSGVNILREFEASDMARVLDFEEASGKSNAVGDESIMVADYVGDGTSHITFPKYFVVLRAGFIFCFQESDVDAGGGRYTTYEAPPVRVVPLDRVDVQFPPGGRRVFREHAQTAAQTGYELIVQHTPADDDEERRPPVFLVAESLGKRNKWAEAIRARSKFTKKTVLRAGYNHTAAAAAAAAEDPLSQSNREERKRNLESRNGNMSRNDEMLAMTQDDEPKKTIAVGLSRSARKGDARTMEKKIMEVSHDAELASAVLQFGSPDYSEEEWMGKYWQTHHDAEALETSRQMEQWLLNMKKSLKGAVLEQYEYFVQASGEMTTMGREVASLKTRIETQVDTLREMKEIDFLGALNADDRSDKDELMGREGDDDSDVVQNGQTPEDGIFGDDLGETMNRHRGVSKATESETVSEEASPVIEVPEWLEDAEEEIMATIRECRYNSAIDLYLKAMNEINDLVDKHDRPTAYRLTRSQLDNLRATRRAIKVLGDGISARLVESLRRRNEALKQANKRERSDAIASLAPIVSPCSLNDDALYLQLLAKLGRTQEAAEAYSGRRSLLLLETLQERPMSGAGTVDLVIYAAQLSQSFFSCLASSVEGFLDLFLVSAPPPTLNGDKSEDSDASSLHSHSLGPATKNLPAGAVSALVLWCDSELSKFAIAFGGTRILSNLALSPPKGTDAPKGPRVVEGSGTTDTSKDRKNAIEVAAQCIDQAFLYASKNLDSVGLPLTPRLAEMIRVRLKGCEREVSVLLDLRWHNLTQDWRTKMDGTSSFSLGPPRY